MSNYLVDGADLTSVANAIRAKSGGSASLAFPGGFVSEIGSIQTGGGGHTQFTFDNTITTVGGRDNAHAVVVGLLPYQQIEIVGYAYLVGATTVQDARLNFGLTQEQFTPHFYLNTDGDTTTQFRITGEFVNGAMKYVYSYPRQSDYTNTRKIMYNEFAFHWITLPSADTPVVIHATVTASY